MFVSLPKYIHFSNWTHEAGEQNEEPYRVSHISKEETDLGLYILILFMSNNQSMSLKMTSILLALMTPRNHIPLPKY